MEAREGRADAVGDRGAQVRGEPLALGGGHAVGGGVGVVLALLPIVAAAPSGREERPVLVRGREELREDVRHAVDRRGAGDQPVGQAPAQGGGVGVGVGAHRAPALHEGGPALGRRRPLVVRHLEQVGRQRRRAGPRSRRAGPCRCRRRRPASDSRERGVGDGLRPAGRRGGRAPRGGRGAGRTGPGRSRAPRAWDRGVGRRSARRRRSWRTAGSPRGRPPSSRRRGRRGPSGALGRSAACRSSAPC